MNLAAVGFALLFSMTASITYTAKLIFSSFSTQPCPGCSGSVHSQLVVCGPSISLYELIVLRKKCCLLWSQRLTYTCSWLPSCVTGLPTALAPDLATLLVFCFLATVSNAQVTSLTAICKVSLANRAKNGTRALWELACLFLLVYLIGVLCLSWDVILYTTSFPSLWKQLSLSTIPLSTTVW